MRHIILLVTLFVAFGSAESLRRLKHPAAPFPTLSPLTNQPEPDYFNFTQKHCDDRNCSENCQEATYPQSTCLHMQGGGSAMATCTLAGLNMTQWRSSDCGGPAEATRLEPINKCLLDTAGTYFENICRHIHPTPAPAPPTIPPAPTGYIYYQIHCPTSNCTFGCDNETFPQSTCLPVRGGGSAMVSCVPAGLNVSTWRSGDCGGPVNYHVEPVDRCLETTSGGYMMNQCVPSNYRMGEFLLQKLTKKAKGPLAKWSRV